MVSSGAVQSDMSSLNSSFTQYSSVIDSLSGAWKGTSYENLVSKAQAFLDEFSKVIANQLEAFANACGLYEEYVNVKNTISTLESNYNAAVANKDNNSASHYASELNSYRTKLNQIKQQIESSLNSASSPKLEATSLTGATSVSLAASSGVQSAIDWALATAADDTHGYSRKTRWGNPNYDCSAFVISSFEAAGFQVKEAGAGYTGNMRRAFTKVGFVWIPGNPSVDDLQPGDVLLNENQHTELYIGDGKMVGAHGDKDGRDGDSSGNEISIVNYYGGWQGILRYVGNTNADDDEDK